MIKSTRDKPKTSNKKLTNLDFYTPRSAFSSSQPHSSQPGPPVTPENTQGFDRPSRKQTALPSHQDVISISSGGELTPLPSDSDSAPASHISISSDTTNSVIIIPDSSSPKQPNISIVNIHKKQPIKSRIAPQPVPNSSAKTTVKRKTRPSPSASSSIFHARKRKKLDFDRSSDESTGEIFVPKPSGMKSSLSCAPKNQITAAAVKGCILPLAANLINLPTIPTEPAPRHFSLPSKRLHISPIARLPSNQIVPPEAENLMGNDGNEADIELVPSSQSDEQELCMTKDIRKDPLELRENVDRWRRESSVVSPLMKLASLPPSDDPALIPDEFNFGVDEDDICAPEVNSMDLDEPTNITAVASVENLTLRINPNETASFGVPSSGSEDEVLRELQRKSSIAFSSAPNQTPPTSPLTLMHGTPPRLPSGGETRPITPLTGYSAEVLPLHKTPPVLTPNSKTAQLIAHIKASVKAKVTSTSSSPNGSLNYDFPEELSDSEQSDDGLAFIKSSKQYSPPEDHNTSSRTISSRSLLTTPITVTPEAEPQVSRYSFRHPRTSTSRSPSSLPTIISINHRSTKAKNALDTLLREKRRGDTSGRGEEHIKLAEATLMEEGERKRQLKDGVTELIHGEDESEIEGDDCCVEWADEAAATEIVRQAACGFRNKELAVDEAAAKFLGEKGRVVGKILADDQRDCVPKEKGEQGVALWRNTFILQQHIEIDVLDVEVPPLPLSNSTTHKNRAFSLLTSVIADGNQIRLSTLLTSSFWSQIKPTDSVTLVPWLYHISLSSENSLLSQRAFELLVHLASCNTVTPGISTVVVSSLLRLGANVDMLKEVGISDVPNVGVRQLSMEGRNIFINRMICLVKAFSLNDCIAAGDVPTIIRSLILLGMDSASELSLRADIMNVIDILLSALPNDSHWNFELDYKLCGSLLAYSHNMTMPNKSLLLSLLSGGSSQAMRVARRLAYGLLLGTEALAKTHDAHIPLRPILELLCPQSGSRAIFDIVGNAETTNYYENLFCHIEILNIVMTDINGYVALEKKSDPNSTQTNKKGKNELEMISDLLNVLHGKIVDTRAAHLDRSRAKAALQQLSIRIHYQRLASIEAGIGRTGAPRHRNLHGYFGVKN